MNLFKKFSIKLYGLFLYTFVAIMRNKLPYQLDEAPAHLHNTPLIVLVTPNCSEVKLR